MKIFLTCASFRTEYGGPAFSVSGLGMALARGGSEVGVWAPDGSAVNSAVFANANDVKRLAGTATDALRHFGKPDVLHDNGIWLPYNHELASVAKSRRIPRIVSLRGMLNPLSMNQKKWKKEIAWILYQKSDLQAAICHHVTSELEAQNAARLKLGVPLCIVPNGIDLPDWSACAERFDAPRKAGKTALFLGRVHPQKGLPMLIEAWDRIRPDGWSLRVVGPDKNDHRADLLKLVCGKRLEHHIIFSGPVTGHRKSNVYRDSDLFILPSYSENFGMTIAEALSFGVPVITTTGTPWANLQAHGCGWTVSPSVEGLVSALREAIVLDEQTLKAMGRRGHEWVTSEFDWKKIAFGFERIYRKCLDGKIKAPQQMQVNIN